MTEHLNLQNLVTFFQASSYARGLVRGEGSARQGQQAPYSLHWYFKDYLEKDIEWTPAAQGHNLLRLYLEVENQNLRQNFLQVLDRQIEHRDKLIQDLSTLQHIWFPNSGKLNDSQIKALANAQHFPISFVQGPPGTGKTMTIVRMAAMAASQGKSVAILSTNRTAVQNVADSLDKLRRLYPTNAPIDYSNWLQHASSRFQMLGNSKNRADASIPGFKFASVGGWESNISFGEFTQRYPIVLSTIHSLKRCFKDGADPANKYDLVILDECSQIDIEVGLVAMSSAHKLVLVGDVEQIPPIVNSAALEDLQNQESSLYQSVENTPYNLYRENNSFLSSCQEVFRFLEESPRSENIHCNVLLDEHYRCHRGIIGFCNQEIYDNKLQVKTKSEQYTTHDIEIPIQIRYFNGSYTEKIVTNFSQENFHTSKINRKQIEIFEYELAPEILQKVNEGKTIGVLTPFREQTNLIKECLARLDNHQEIVVETEDLLGIAENNLGDSKKELTSKGQGYLASIRTQTVHKSQGQEFDIVYLFPVEDEVWRWPWSQGRQLVNVAVSRAKEELHVIASSQIFGVDLYQKLLGGTLQTKTPIETDEDKEHQYLYVRRLIDYVDSKTKMPQEGFGIRPSSLVSVFDKIPKHRREIFMKREQQAENARLNNQSIKITNEYATEHAFENAISTIKDSYPDIEIGNQHWLDNITWKNLRLPRQLANRGMDEKYTKFVEGASHFDYVIYWGQKDKNGWLSTDQILLAIEVDGGFHRSVSAYQNLQTLLDTQQRDSLKNEIVQHLGGAILHGNNKKDLDLLNKTSSFPLLRLPTDGSTYWETKAIRSSVGVGMTKSHKFTLEDLLRAQLKNITQLVESWAEEFPSECLKLLGPNPNTYPKNINKILIELGYLFENELGRKVPTLQGKAIGILEFDYTNKGNKSYALYSPYSARFLWEELRKKQ